LTKLEYKAAEAGTRLIRVPPRGTSQNCSGCGVVVPKRLSERTHRCPACDLVIDRDTNAARNILRLGLSRQASTWPTGRALPEKASSVRQGCHCPVFICGSPPAASLHHGLLGGRLLEEASKGLTSTGRPRSAVPVTAPSTRKVGTECGVFVLKTSGPVTLRQDLRAASVDQERRIPRR